MNLLILPLSILCGLVLCSAAASIFAAHRAHRLFSEVNARVREAATERTADLQPLRENLDALAGQLQELRSQPQTVTAPGVPKSGFNLSQRSQALRMHRRGEPAGQIAASLGLARQEVELLLKVHQIVIQNV